MEEIIKKAIEGGWKEGFHWKPVNSTKDHNNEVFISKDARIQLEINKYQIFCDPLFFQALGKACRWSEYSVCRKHGEIQCFRSNCFEGYGKEWVYHAIQFHEMTLTESFEEAVEYLQNLIKE